MHGFDNLVLKLIKLKKFHLFYRLRKGNQERSQNYASLSNFLLSTLGRTNQILQDQALKQDFTSRLLIDLSDPFKREIPAFRQDNAAFRQDNAAFRQDNAALRQDNAALRQEIKDLNNKLIEGSERRLSMPTPPPLSPEQNSGQASNSNINNRLNTNFRFSPFEERQDRVSFSNKPDLNSNKLC